MKKSLDALMRGSRSRKRCGVAVGELLRRDALALGDLRDRLAVLVGAGEEEHVLAALAVMAGEDVGADRRVRVAEVRRRVHVVDGRRDVEGHGGRQRLAAAMPPPRATRRRSRRPFEPGADCRARTAVAVRGAARRGGAGAPRRSPTRPRRQSSSARPAQTGHGADGAAWPGRRAGAGARRRARRGRAARGARPPAAGREPRRGARAARAAPGRRGRGAARRRRRPGAASSAAGPRSRTGRASRRTPTWRPPWPRRDRAERRAGADRRARRGRRPPQRQVAHAPGAAARC